MTTQFSQLWKRAEGVSRTSSQEQEMQRILSLPVMDPLTPEEFEAFNRAELLDEAYRSGFRLFPVQADAVMAYDENGGLFAPVGVGRGKSLISLMIASRAYWRGVERVMMFLPPQLITKLRRSDLPWAKKRVLLHPPIHYLNGASPQKRKQLRNRRAPGLYVMPYSLLSQPDAEAMLEVLGPDLLVFDEAHYVKNKKKGARGRRVFKYIKEHKPQCVFLSGTMTRKSIIEYHHMISSALGDNCPLPLPVSLVESWAAKIDAGAEESDNHPAAAGGMRPLISWAHKQGLEVPPNLIGLRRAYRHRLHTAPGVVSTPDDDIGVSLTIRNLPVPDYEQHPAWPVLDGLMLRVDKQYISPSGDEIESAMHRWRYIKELTAGFYNKLVWPEPVKLAERKGISEAEAQDKIEGSRIHHKALQEYHRILRKFLGKVHIRGIDTPMLVGKHLSKEKAKGLPKTYGPDLYETWQEAKDLEFVGMVERESSGVRVCDYKIQHAIKWYKSLPAGTPALIWFDNIEMGAWTAEMFREAGIDTLHCPAGPQANNALAAIEQSGKCNQAVVLSIKAHMEGKNLQEAIQESFYIQTPRDATWMQQSIGRLHRSGQPADELFVTQCLTTAFDSENFAACLVDAAYQHASGGNRQKIIYAGYDPLPQMYPPEFLNERGLEVQKLDDQERLLLTEKFKH